jgi:L-seryl-tRNA(Ser) seleniumtransferase
VQLNAASVKAVVVDSAGVVGGGGAPGVVLSGSAIALAQRLGKPLRTGRPPVLGRVEKGRLLLDLRCISPDDDGVLCDAVLRASGLSG